MKNSLLPVKTIAAFLLLQGSLNLFSQTLQVDGIALLEGQSDHSGIMIAFERFAPQTSYDTAYSDSAGYYAIQLEQGLYNLSYSKEGFIGVDLTGIQVYSDVTLPDAILEQEGLTGSISGVLTSGIYVITGDIEVENGDTLIIEPGTILRFKPETNFWINGLLLAEGTVTDSILFTKYDDETGWWGIQFGSLADDNSVISFATIEHSDEVGVSIGGCSPHIHNSVIRNNHNLYFQRHGGGIYISNSDAMLENLEIYGNGADLGGGLYVFIVTNYPDDAYRPVIANCLIYNNIADDGGGIFFETWIYNGVLSYPLLINSTVSKNSSSGVSGSGETWMPDIINNNIAFNDGYGIKSSLGGIHYCAYNNIANNSAGNFYNPPEWVGQNITVNSNGDSCDAYHNIQYDPAFENLDENDFHLTIESPCIDAGLNDSVVTSEDYDGNPRILFGANSYTVDMGAYEKLPVGIADVQHKEFPELLIIPNPAREWILISLPGENHTANSFLEIYDARGMKLEQVFQADISGSFALNIRNYPPGIYFAIVRKGNSILANGKFVVIK